jgi:effector-binding domain-containing protein
MHRFLIALLTLWFLSQDVVLAGEDYQVQLKEASPETLMCLGGKSTMENIGKDMPNHYGRLFQHVIAEQITTTGPPRTVYYSPPGEEMEYDACVPVPESVRGNEVIRIRELDGGRAASLIHKGPHEGLGKAYEALMKWMEQEGYERSGPAREIYLVGPPKKPAEYRTELLWPVRKK